MTRTLLSAATLLIAAAPQLVPRTIPQYSYDELFARSDLVVIAEPLRKTRDTPERSTLPYVSPPHRAIGVETEFRAELVLKGRKRDRFVLHHYRERPEPPRKGPDGVERVLVDGLLLVTFDPKKNSEYLLFLVREPDGRFAPTGGQTDVDTVSIWQLSSMDAE